MFLMLMHACTHILKYILQLFYSSNLYMRLSIKSMKNKSRYKTHYINNNDNINFMAHNI